MTEKEIEDWEETRKMGIFKYVLIYGMLVFGVPMFIAMTFFAKDAFDAEGNLNVFHIQINAVGWSLGGILAGLFQWWQSEKKYKKAFKEKAEHNKQNQNGQ